MPISLPNTTVGNAYPNPGAGGAQAAGNDIFESGWFTVANASVFCEFEYGIFGDTKFSPEIFLAPGTYPLAGSLANPLNGIRFRNAVAGANAQVWGAFFYKNDPVLSSSAEFTATVTPSGGVVQNVPGTEIAYGQITATHLFASTGQERIVTAPSFNADGATKIVVSFYSAKILMPSVGGGGTTLTLHDDSLGIDLGFLGDFQESRADSGTQMQIGVPMFAQYEYTPAAGAHILGVNGVTSFVNGSTGVYAGNGSAGQYSPCFIRVQIV